MYEVRYPGLVIDQTTGDEGISMIYRTFDSLLHAQTFITDYTHQYPEFSELCHISLPS